MSIDTDMAVTAAIVVVGFWLVTLFRVFVLERE